MKAYPAYKDSGVEWLGEIPECWKVRKLKFCDEVTMGQSPSSEDYNTDFVGLPFLQGNADFNLLYPKPRIWCDTANKIAEVNDILLSVRAPIGAINIADQKYGIGRGLCAIRPSKTYKKYLYYTALCLHDELNSIGTGSTFTAVSVDEIKNLTIPYPPLPEQRTIAAFLDHKTRLIDTYVAKKQQQIERLQAYRTALINQAVTKGLNPDTPMKDSGIEWLGEIPVSWEIVQLGRLIRLQRGVDITKAQQVEGNIPVVSSGGISSYHNKSTARGPGVIVGRKGTLGTVHYVESDYWAHDTTLWVKEFKGSYPRYIYYLLKIMRLEKFDTGSANPTLNRNIVHPEYVPFTPKKEQMEIASYLDEQTAKIDNLIAKTQHQIDRLQAYRTALISDAVTGKIDVRTDNYKDYT